MNRIVELITEFRVKNQREWKALLSTFFSMFNKFIALISVIFYVRWTLPYLGNERFGVWMTLSTIITFVTIFSDLGLGSSLVNNIAYSKAKSETGKLKEYTSSAFFFLSVMGLLTGLLFYFVQLPIISSIGNGLVEGKDFQELKYSLYCLFAIFVLSLPFVTVDKTLEGLQLNYISAIWASIGSILSLIITYFVTTRSLGIFWLILSTMGVQSMFRMIYFNIEFYGRLKHFRPSFSEIDIQKTLKLLRSGILFFILNIFNVLAFQIDNVIISKELGIGNVPLFSLMQKLVTISLFFWFYTISLWPAFAEAHSKNDKEWIEKTVYFVFKLNMAVGVFFGLIIIFLSQPILSFWSKDLIASPSFIMRGGFALYILLNGMIGTVAIVFNTGPLLKTHVIWFCIASVTTVFLKFIFIKKLGVDYIIYMSFLPYLLFYITPCYFKYRAYVKN